MRHALIVIVCLVVSSAGALVAAAGNDLDVVEKVLTAPPATGLVVSLVRDDSRAEQAGIRLGDTIVRYDEKPTPTLDALAKAKALAEQDGKKEIPVDLV